MPGRAIKCRAVEPLQTMSVEQTVPRPSRKDRKPHHLTYDLKKDWEDTVSHGRDKHDDLTYDLNKEDWEATVTHEREKHDDPTRETQYEPVGRRHSVSEHPVEAAAAETDQASNTLSSAPVKQRRHPRARPRKPKSVVTPDRGVQAESSQDIAYIGYLSEAAPATSTVTSAETCSKTMSRTEPLETNWNLVKEGGNAFQHVNTDQEVIQWQSTPALFVAVMQVQITHVPCMLDSGSMINIMSPECANSLGLSRHKLKLPLCVKTANGSEER